MLGGAEFIPSTVSLEDLKMSEIDNRDALPETNNEFTPEN